MDKMKDESSNAKKENDKIVSEAITDIQFFDFLNHPVFDFLNHPEEDCFLLKTFISLTKDVEPDNENVFLKNMKAIILSGAKNPCIMNQEELFDMRIYRPKEKELIYKMNDELNNAESIEEIENCLEKAKKEKIAVRDEYVCIFHFVNDLKKMKESFESIGGNTQHLLASAIQAMLSSFNLAIVECSLEYQERIRKNFKDHNEKKENDLLMIISDFGDYLLEIEAYWSSEKKKRVLNFELASSHVFNKHMEKNDEILKNLFNHYYGIDCTDRNNTKKCISILTVLTKEFRSRFLAKQSDYSNKPQKRKTRSEESRKKSSEGQKRAIERKKRKHEEL